MTLKKRFCEDEIILNKLNFSKTAHMVVLVIAIFAQSQQSNRQAHQQQKILVISQSLILMKSLILNEIRILEQLLIILITSSFRWKLNWRLSPVYGNQPFMVIDNCLTEHKSWWYLSWNRDCCFFNNIACLFISQAPKQ